MGECVEWRGEEVRLLSLWCEGRMDWGGKGGVSREGVGKKKALCGNRRPSNDCLPYEKS